jgi:hypothetical protein
MLRVTVEIWPGGDETRARVLATAAVGNVSDLAETSDYDVSVTEGRNPLTNTPPWSRRGYVLQHDRRKSVWALVAKVAMWAAEEAAKTRR